MRAAAILALALIAAALPAHAELSATAHFANPTERYGHGALGPGHEFESLRITVRRSTGDGKGLFSGATNLTYDLTLGPDLVWEDTAPRVMDLDGDGVPEIIVVQSSLSQGSRLIVLTLDKGKPVLAVDGPFVGERNHWLSVIGAGDLDGDGRPEIALIDAPHRLGKLVIYRYLRGKLTEVGRGGDVSNHHYGADHALGGLRDCAQQPEMIVASFDWSRLVALRLSPDGRVTRRELGADTSPAAFDAALSCKI
ncbi:FG-GAP repeat domain-containing protein [Thioclava sp. 15-R06ZXC-3]|uniref:FG-GAP repeat domain-containing protein n=1 Tax=Thioclava arctica TaxID=3238301 RepID=A0ABV3TNB2_9RHOB